MNNGPLHSVSVAGVTLDATDRVLLIKRRDNEQWQAPGGILEVSETFEQGVAREVLEETGVRVTVERLTGVYKNITRGVVALVFRCAYVEGQPIPTDEAVESAWVPVKEAVALMSPAFAIRVQDAFEGDGRMVPTRTHDGVQIADNVDARPR